MSQYQYGQFGREHLKKIVAGLELYNQQKYWECHELLEDHWLEDVGDQARLVYWAVIQAATALYHARNENLAGACGMLIKAQEKLDRLEASRVETKLLTAIRWTKFKKLVKSIPGREASLDDFNDLRDFKFSLPKVENL